MNIIQELIKLADSLDKRGLKKEANLVDCLLRQASTPRFTIRKGDGFDYVQDQSHVSKINNEDRPSESPAMIPSEASSLANKLNEADQQGKRIFDFRVA